MQWIVRAPTWDETIALRERVVNCIKCGIPPLPSSQLRRLPSISLDHLSRAAALATATTVDIQFGGYTFDLRQNDVLGSFKPPLTDVRCLIASPCTPTNECSEKLCGRHIEVRHRDQQVD